MQLIIPENLDLWQRLRWIECCRESLRREHNRRSAADVAAWRVWERETFQPRSTAIVQARLAWRAERAWPVVLDADGMPMPDAESGAVTVAVRALPDDAPEFAIDWQEVCNG